MIEYFVFNFKVISFSFDSFTRNIENVYHNINFVKTFNEKGLN